MIYKRIFRNSIKRISSNSSGEKKIDVKVRKHLFAKTPTADSPCMKCVDLGWINIFHSWIFQGRC